MGTRIESRGSWLASVKNTFNRIGEMLGPDIVDNEEEGLDIKNNDTLTQEEKSVLFEGMKKFKEQEKEFEDFKTRVKEPNKNANSEKTIINKDNVKEKAKAVSEPTRPIENIDIDEDIDK